MHYITLWLPPLHAADVVFLERLKENTQTWKSYSYSGHIWSIKISDSELYLFFFLSVFHQTTHKLWLLNDRVTTLTQSIHPSLFNSCPPPFIYIPSCSGFTAVYLSRSRCLPKNPRGFLLHMKLVYIHILPPCPLSVCGCCLRCVLEKWGKDGFLIFSHYISLFYNWNRLKGRRTGPFSCGWQ